MSEASIEERLSATGTLHVLLKKAMGLDSADLNGKSDPYVVATSAGQTRKTSIKPKTLNPVWNENYEMEGTLSDFVNSGLALNVFDCDNPARPDKDGEKPACCTQEEPCTPRPLYAQALNSSLRLHQHASIQMCHPPPTSSHPPSLAHLTHYISSSHPRLLPTDSLGEIAISLECMRYEDTHEFAEVLPTKGKVYFQVTWELPPVSRLQQCCLLSSYLPSHSFSRPSHSVHNAHSSAPTSPTAFSALSLSLSSPPPPPLPFHTLRT